MEEVRPCLPPDPLWRSVGGLIRDLYSPPGALSYFEFSVVRAADISDFHRRFGERTQEFADKLRDELAAMNDVYRRKSVAYA